MTKQDVITALKISSNCFFPLPEGQIGFEGIIQDYSMFSQLKHMDLIKNNLKCEYGLAIDGKLIIAFRGSQNDTDWKYNFNYAQKDAHFDMQPYGKVTSTGVGIHTGFRDDYWQVESEIREIVKYFVEGGIKEVFVTGHSLGGALAQVCALDIQYNFYKDVIVSSVTFGAPRTYNIAGATSYNGRVPNTIRVVNGSDPVTKVPFSEMITIDGKEVRYAHVGKELQIDKNWMIFPQNWVPPFCFLQHAPSLYMQHLNSMSFDEFNGKINVR